MHIHIYKQIVYMIESYMHICISICIIPTCTTYLIYISIQVNTQTYTYIYKYVHVKIYTYI